MTPALFMDKIYVNAIMLMLNGEHPRRSKHSRLDVVRWIHGRIRWEAMEEAR